MMQRNSGTRASRLLRLDDPGQAFNLDRVISLRLTLFDSEMAKAQADALSGGREPDIESLFKSNETGSFAH
jgi:hypothetical protein